MTYTRASGRPHTDDVASLSEGLLPRLRELVRDFYRAEKPPFSYQGVPLAQLYRSRNELAESILDMDAEQRRDFVALLRGAPRNTNTHLEHMAACLSDPDSTEGDIRENVDVILDGDDNDSCESWAKVLLRVAVSMVMGTAAGDEEGLLPLTKEELYSSAGVGLAHSERPATLGLMDPSTLTRSFVMSGIEHSLGLEVLSTTDASDAQVAAAVSDPKRMPTPEFYTAAIVANRMKSMKDLQLFEQEASPCLEAMLRAAYKRSGAPADRIADCTSWHPRKDSRPTPFLIVLLIALGLSAAAQERAGNSELREAHDRLLLSIDLESSDDIREVRPHPLNTLPQIWEDALLMGAMLHLNDLELTDFLTALFKLYGTSITDREQDECSYDDLGQIVLEWDKLPRGVAVEWRLQLAYAAVVSQDGAEDIADAAKTPEVVAL